LAHTYALTTQLQSQAIHRRGEPFYSSQHPSGNPRLAPPTPAAMHVLLTLQDVDPANPQPPQVLFDGEVPFPPAFARYAAVNGGGFNASIQYTRISRVSEALVRSAPSGLDWHTRFLLGESSGAECEILSTRELKFFSTHVPAAGERIVVRYRAFGRTLAQAADRASVAAQPQNPAGGVRYAIANLALPVPQTTADCEQAALAILDDTVQPAFTGQYRAPAEALTADVWPGDALLFNLPSQAAGFTAFARQVEITARDPAGDGYQYAIDFANDAAAPLSLELSHSISKKRSIGGTTMIPIAGAAYLPDLTAAEVSSVAAGLVNIDAGLTPPVGGGIEVRRGDSGWGLADDFNLLGRFTTQTFTVPKMARVADYYLRQFDASGLYSRFSALLHVDQP